MEKSFLVCGGDLRQINVANLLSSYGYDVFAFGFDSSEGFDKSVKCFDEISDAIRNVDIVILPLPCSIDNITINMPMSERKTNFAELLKNMNKNQIIVAGKVPEKILNLTHMYNIYIADYFEREELTVLNTIPTVEGAVQIAMEETPITIHGSNCLVCGFGRIGKLLAKALKDLGANVTVSARKLSDLAWIKAFGYKGIETKDIAQVVTGQNIIFNTIEFLIFDEVLLSRVDSNTLIIDLASKPGGIDFDFASQLGKKVIWALSLPGKVAPVTAGKIITDSIINLVTELGV